MSRNTEHACVLSGGGASGAYEIGVLKALLAFGSRHAGGRIDPGIYSGTSVGAFNAAFMASPEDGEDGSATAERLADVWSEVIAEGPGSCGNGAFRIRGNPLELLSPACWSRGPARPIADLVGDGGFLTADVWKRLTHFSRSRDESLLERLLELPDLSAVISTEPMRALIRDQIDLARLRRSAKRLRVVATDWRRGLPFVFGKADLDDADGHRKILASTAIPAVFPPVTIGDDVFVDGGMTMNTPLKPAITAWREASGRAENLVLHVVYLDPELQDIPLAEVPSTFATVSRIALFTLAQNHTKDIEYAAKLNRQIAVAGKVAAEAAKHTLTIHRYRPHGDLGGVLGLLDFRKERVEQLIEEGFEETLKHDCEREGCVLADASPTG